MWVKLHFLKIITQFSDLYSAMANFEYTSIHGMMQCCVTHSVWPSVRLPLSHIVAAHTIHSASGALLRPRPMCLRHPTARVGVSPCGVPCCYSTVHTRVAIQVASPVPCVGCAGGPTRCRAAAAYVMWRTESGCSSASSSCRVYVYVVVVWYVLSALW